MNLDKLLPDVCSIAKECGQFLLNECHKVTQKDIETKAEHDYVTYVDKASEEFLIASLSKLLPETGIIAEEGHAQRNSFRYNWIIDPLDGTTNYIHGMAPYAVSIALCDHNTEILGVIFEPNLDECFSVHANSQAFLNNKPIKVSGTKKLFDAFLATGFPSRDYTHLEAYVMMFKELMFDTQGIRRLGSAAMDMAYVACGRFDAFYEYYLSSWDVAAGSLMVKKAGGRVSDFHGSDNYLFGKEIVCSNGLIQDELLEIIRKHFNTT